MTNETRVYEDVIRWCGGNRWKSERMGTDYLDLRGTIARSLEYAIDVRAADVINIRIDRPIS